MGLEVHLVAAVSLAGATINVVETHFHHGSRGEVGGDVATHPATTVIGLQHHGHRIPANDASDPGLQLYIPGIARLIGHIDRIHVIRIEGSLGQNHTTTAELLLQLDQQGLGFFGPTVLQHVGQGVEPFFLFCQPFIAHGVIVDAAMVVVLFCHLGFFHAMPAGRGWKDGSLGKGYHLPGGFFVKRSIITPGSRENEPRLGKHPVPD